MKLYSYWRSSAAYRVRIALNYKQIPYQQVTPNLAKQEQRSAGYLALNPQGLVPSLELDGAHAGEIISQSLAIIEYLEAVKQQPSLFPVDPLARARVNTMALAIACDIHPMNNQRVLRYLKVELGQDDASVNQWYARWICDGFAAVEAWASEYSSDGRYLFGDAVSLADVLLVPQMYNARRFEVNLQAFPTLLSVDKHLCSLPAFAAAAPELQPDAT
jgi:maleylacetoacetate isomerase/maleylpyruvate isomerase